MTHETPTWKKLLDVADAELAALRAENDRLRAALEYARDRFESMALSGDRTAMDAALGRMDAAGEDGDPHSR